MSPPDLRIETQEVGWLEDGRLGILWKDKHESSYPLEYLRKNCPCAECSFTRQSAQSGLRVIQKPISSDLKVIAVHQVGNYALQFKWSDGHSTGIYSFEFLRRICPCGKCQER